MAVIFLAPDFGHLPPRLIWTCPCGQLNYHNGHANKMEPEEKAAMEETIERVTQAQVQELEDAGADIESLEVGALVTPDEVWCAKCEERHITHPSVDDPEWYKHIGEDDGQSQI